MSSARQAAAETLHAVCEKGISLDDALIEYGALVSDKESSLYRALSYGGVRYYLAYQNELKSRLKKPFKPKDRILTAILVSALYQLDQTAQQTHAVVNEAVSLSKHFKRQWAAGLVNAVLRATIRDVQQRLAVDLPERVRSNYPAWLSVQIELAWPEHVAAILLASQAKPPLTLRINQRQSSREDYFIRLEQAGMHATLCSDSPVGLTLDKPRAVDKIPGFVEATVSVQDESAQLATLMLDLAPTQRVLDACAAPGGKSLHILEMEPQLSRLQVLDFPARLPRLRENFERAAADADILAGDLLEPGDWWDGEPYDRILLDVPCTGTGVMRRHPDIKFRRQPENALQFASTQLQLLRQAWRLLKPDGKLLYTTCSILPAENEHCIAGFIAQTSDAHALPLTSYAGIETDHGLQRLPGVHSGDGFFYALIHKMPLDS